MANYSYSSAMHVAKKAFSSGNFHTSLEAAIQARHLALTLMDEVITSYYVQSAHKIVQDSYANLRGA